MKKLLCIVTVATAVATVTTSMFFGLNSDRTINNTIENSINETQNKDEPEFIDQLSTFFESNSNQTRSIDNIHVCINI